MENIVLNKGFVSKGELPESEGPCWCVRKGHNYHILLCWNPDCDCWDDGDGDDYYCDTNEIDEWIKLP